MNIYNHTEFDEQSASKETALELVRIKTTEAMAGLETWAVVGGYEVAALKQGATMDEIEARYPARG